MRQVLICLLCNRRHRTCATELHCFPAVCTNWSSYAQGQTVSRLYRIPRRGHPDVLIKWYDLCCPQQCKLPQQTEHQEPCRWALLPLKGRWQPTKQWSNPKYRQNHEKMSWLQPPKQNWGHSTSLQRNMYTSLSFSKKLDTSSPQHLFKPTIPQPKVLSTARSNQNGQRRWTCNSTG